MLGRAGSPTRTGRLLESALRFLLITLLVACAREQATPRPVEKRASEPKGEEAKDHDFDAYPRYGLVSSIVMVVRKSAQTDAVPLGWLRRGETVRLKAASIYAPRCRGGFYALHPQGFVCASDGVQLSEAPPNADAGTSSQADRDSALPYQYYLVKDSKTPEFHELPNREQQRVAQAYLDAWAQVLADDDAAKTAKFEAGELDGKPKKPGMVRRFLERGYYVASTDLETSAQRKFAHTVRGSFVKEQQLVAKQGAQFHGVELHAGQTLPVVWAVRTSIPQRLQTSATGVARLVDANDSTPIERLALVPNWKKWTHVGDKLVHELSDGTYLQDWYLAVAERIARPKEVGAHEPWVHVDVGEQTLVLYEGDEPRYATLVSTGVNEHETPLGSFRVQRKYVTDGMSDIGADSDARYSIEDVPWTQYFDGSRALHAAFWHAHFGLKRSHGCINLSPADAFFVFQRTWPALPSGWHGVSTQKTGLKGSLVLVTE